jgi:hypothetical protein
MATPSTVLTVGFGSFGSTALILGAGLGGFSGGGGGGGHRPHAVRVIIPSDRRPLSVADQAPSPYLPR